MNAHEARRFAHRFIADTVRNELMSSTASDYAWIESKDRAKIIAALDALIEQHERFGPKSTDRAPREAEAKPSIGLPLEPVEPEPLPATPDPIAPERSEIRLTLAPDSDDLPAEGSTSTAEPRCSARRLFGRADPQWRQCIRTVHEDVDHQFTP